MADIDFRGAHGVDAQSARASAERIERELGERFGLRGEWDGDTLRFSRSGVSGFLRIGEEELHLSVTLGMLLKALKSPIERAVGAQLATLFPAGDFESS
jgi:putative polyhydroxyalkanoate system protein